MSVSDVSHWEWLEQPEAPECLEWASKETQSTIDRIATMPNYDSLQKRISELVLGNEPVPHFWSSGGNLFRLRKDADLHKRGLFERAKGQPKGMHIEWEPVLDVDALGKAEGKVLEFQLFAVSSHILGSRLLVMVSDGGSDEVELREYDMDKREFVADGFQAAAGRTNVAWLDADHLLINHALNGGPTTASGWPVESFIWRRGTLLRDARLVHSISPSDALAMVNSIGDDSGRRGIIMRAIDYATIVFYLVSVDGAVEEVKLPAKPKMCPSLSCTLHHLVVATTEKAIVGGREVPPATYLAYHIAPGVPEDQRVSIIYTPEEEEFNPSLFIDGLAASRTRVYITLSKRGLERRLILEYDGPSISWKTVRSFQTMVGSHACIIATDRESDNVLAKCSGFLSPCVVSLEYADGADTAIHSQPSVIENSQFVLELHSATSKDGTSIDYVMVSPKSAAETNAPSRVLMTGYGAYGLTIPMNYLEDLLGGLSLVPWFENGGRLVVPAIRGGGERGEEWHQSARQKNRQRSYDDFLAVAEKLIADGIASKGRIGMYGSSNGGLLAGVMGTQGHDIFGAIVSDVPLCDMLRFPLMGMGAAWIYEYGNPEDPELVPVLRAYSPFHNIKEGVKYPPFLVTGSTKDDRVGIGHARKMVARLHEVQSPNAFLYEAQDGGHGISDPTKNPTLLARRTAFFMNFLE